MSNAQNGARIKAWAGKNVGSGLVKNITFTNFTETNVDNPVIIDQVCLQANAVNAVFLISRRSYTLSATRRPPPTARSTPQTPSSKTSGLTGEPSNRPAETRP